MSQNENEKETEKKIEEEEIKIDENVAEYEKEFYKLKLIVLGDTGVGKTNIIRRYISDVFSTDSKSTVGVEFFTKSFRVNNDIVKLEIWDTAGQERYKAITSAYYKGSRGALLVYDITREPTFENIERWINEIKEKVRGSLKMMIIGNKLDLTDQRQVDINNALEKAKKLNVPLMETSALDSTNIQKAFEQILKEMYKEFKKEKEIEKKEQNRIEGVKLETDIKLKNDKNEKKGCC
jgi:Ras-related protein Rab-11A